MNLGEYVDVEYDAANEELTLKMGATDGHWLCDALEKAARNSWDPTMWRQLADKIAAVLPPDERPGLSIVVVRR